MRFCSTLTVVGPEVARYYTEVRGVPLCVVEAMGAGKPVIATDVGGLRLLVKPSKNGLPVRPADPACPGMAMRALTVNRSLRREMGAASRQIAREAFGIPTWSTGTKKSTSRSSLWFERYAPA